MARFNDIDMQALLGKVLRAGTIISISVVFFGGIIYLVRHGHSIARYKTFNGIPAFIQNINGIIDGVMAFKGQAIIQFGIVLLIATPILRVLISAIGFAFEKDYLYVAISLLVLSIILVSMISGHAG